MEDVLTNVPEKRTRPTFLTVLCILTFIGSGWGIISGFTSYASANLAAGISQTAIEDAQRELENEEISNAGTKVANEIFAGMSSVLNPENIRKNAMFSIVSCVLTLLGAVLMFRLSKTGFWLYILGTLVGIAAPFIVYGGTNILTIISSSAIAFIGILFVVLYGLNFKHLR
ncbi:MAG: hypothetical protein KIT80_17170 [Chitinophagaceae bacterium]|nr:hypothetical protein [Chitinophagaceae bacterium]MCW5928653.1 hypothetical protein [Chitinophagaceae bacterium]